MDDSTNEQRPKASLRGKGWQILLGQTSGAETSGENAVPDELPASPAVPAAQDASSLALTPEETEALLDFSPASADLAVPFPAAAPVEEAAPLPEPEEAWWDWITEEPATEKIAGAERESQPLPAQTGEQDAIPLPEQTPRPPVVVGAIPYQAHPDVDALIPMYPEVWPESPAVKSQEEAGGLPPAARKEKTTSPVDEGGLVVPEGAVVNEPVSAEIGDPFESVLKRQPSRVVFPQTAQPEKALLETLVDDEQLKKLWQQIDALHEEVVQNVQGDRGSTDVYQQELLQASSMLLESRANYDDARAIVYRIRADLNRQRKVHSDIMRYRPLLLNYYLGWGIAWIVLFALKGLFSGVAEAVGVDIVSAVYHPILFGVLGALISGYLTLERHATRLHDFDPIHISWYLFNPLLGGVIGLLMFLLYAIANQDVLQESATTLEKSIAWLLCAVAGMNQNTVLRQMNDLLKRFGKSSKT